MSSPFYAMFKLDSGFEFAIYDRNKLQPPTAATSGAAELGFTVADSAYPLHKPRLLHTLSVSA